MEQMTMNPEAIAPVRYDVIIVGAGPAGLCFARSLSGAGLSICIVEQLDDAALAEPPEDGREIALTPASIRLLKLLDIWPRIDAREIAPLRRAQVLDGNSPYHLDLNASDSGHKQLGSLVPNYLIRRAAYHSVVDLPDVELRCGVHATSVAADAADAVMLLSDQSVLRARLIVAADSRFSETRRRMGIPASLHDFGKTMIVCRMAVEQPLQQTASEWFGYGQTMAVLPLNDGVASIVLTLPAEESAALMALDDAGFVAAVEQRADDRLGRLKLVGQRHAYPLVAVYAERFVARRFALIGDAAVGMHPVTAHGFNLGLRSQQTLAREIRTAQTHGRDIGSNAVLARYERAHRRATAPLYVATNALVRVYTNDTLPARLLRRAALRVSNRVTPIRRSLLARITDEGI